MLELFARPEFLVAGGALISAPIIIHLINRMRFKRLRWAAMEFLLKAQKRSRRRLIIEQLILLLLRCLLVALAALLVLRFFGFALGSVFDPQQEKMHIVILNDDLSMHDQHKDAEGARTAFALARKDVVQEGILKGLSNSTTNDLLALVLVSQAALDPKYNPKVYERLNDTARYNQAVEDVELIQPTKIHADLMRGVDKARKLIEDHKGKDITVHVISDFRRHDWTTADARPLQEALLKWAKEGIKVRLIDTAPPLRPEGAQAGAPPYNENLAIVDMRPSTRIAGKGMPVGFTVTVANFSPRDAEVLVTVHDDASGTERFDVHFNERMPLKVPAGETATGTFELKFFPDLKGDNEKEFAHISARIENPDRQPLADGLAEDNVRHVAVEVRNKVPVLIIDGRGSDGRKEGGDSYFIKHALDSVSGPNQESKYDVIYADKLTAAEPMAALESPDLQQYPTILLLNTPTLTAKQVAGLEKFVREGGGVGFFVGPAVDAVGYNKLLYKGGQGVFPVPLEEKYHPPKGQKELAAEFTGRPQLLLRDDQFPSDKGDKIPIFGAIFKEPRLRDFLKHLPVKRYWPALPPHEWKAPPGQVREVANLPNEALVFGGELANEAVSLTDRLPTDKDDYKQYHSSLNKHRREIVSAATNRKTQGSQLAEAINKLLIDRGDGKEYGNLLEGFWKTPDPKIDTLHKDFQNLRRRLMYSHPMVVVSQFGQGRVVAVLTTAGKEWNDWAGGITGSVLYAPIIWEMQNWLSSHSGESGLTVGSPLQLTVDRKRYGTKALKMSRTYLRPIPGKPAVEVALEKEQFPDSEQPADGKEGVKVEVKGGDVKIGEGKINGQPVPGKPALPEGMDSFTFTKTLDPGLYVTKLYFANPADGNQVLATWGHVFNVDARREGKLERASQEALQVSFLSQAPADNPLRAPAAPNVDDPVLTNRPRDLSELPWFFVLFLGILVAEQALAVHLSFHLRGSEAELPSQAVSPHAAKAA
ncbi:MAG: BatA domain-containing protein [Gemmataceae bacterium]|nr:BatA domain-containing protein [Gemmataceae bacterium]